ncbi:MAG: DUF202 domain-containing protein [Planctomycetota bacterium]
MTDDVTAGAAESTLRDALAVERTQLALERTLLAYVRTAIMLIASGATVIKLFGSRQAIVSGWGLVLLGGTVAAIGWNRYSARRRALSTPR